VALPGHSDQFARYAFSAAGVHSSPGAHQRRPLRQYINQRHQMVPCLAGCVFVDDESPEGADGGAV